LFRRKGAYKSCSASQQGRSGEARTREHGAWSIPKGLISPDEAPRSAARREFVEETGYRPQSRAIRLGAARQPRGKVVQVWAVEDDWDPAELESNTFELEWPPRSRRRQTFPEIDRAKWFSIPVARQALPVNDG